MDRTIKFLLGVIAASLVMLNLQLAGVSLVKDAHAEDSLLLKITINRMASDVAEIRDNWMREQILGRVRTKNWTKQIIPMCFDSPTCRHYNPVLTKENLQKLMDIADQ